MVEELKRFAKNSFFFKVFAPIGVLLITLLIANGLKSREPAKSPLQQTVDDLSQQGQSLLSKFSGAIRKTFDYADTGLDGYNREQTGELPDTTTNDIDND